MTSHPFSWKKFRNLFLIGANRLFPISLQLGYPYMAHISPSGLCNLRCEVCPTHDPETKGKGLLPFHTYKKFIDEAGDYLIYIILWNWGEPLLNPDIYKMFHYAEQKGIRTVTSTNFNKFSRKDAQEMVGSGLDALIIAADGTTQESYSKYRRGGNLEKVWEHTREIVDIKRKTGSQKPLLNLRLIVSRENENEMDTFRQIGRKLGVDMVSFKAFSTRQPGYFDVKLERKYAPLQKKYRWYKYHKGYKVNYSPKKYWCRFPWTKPTLFPDGTIISCEFDFRYEHAFGNINQKSFDQIWFSPKAHSFRKQFQKDRDAFDFCKHCVYDYKLIPGCVLEWEFIEQDR
ncbi:MAG: radical SAM protein [Candidatus Aminicenantes bacterium]|nr:radical SAM protein [Candidatus Aminicenantes bacterium]